MKIKIEVARWASKYVKSGAEIDLPEGAAVADAIALVGIPSDNVGFAMVEGKVVRKDYVLKDGDVVTLHATIVGG